MLIQDLERTRDVLSEPRPVLWVMDQDAWAKGLDYARVPLDVSRHVNESLRDEFDKVAAHNEHHLSQVRLALGRQV